jgi:bifunctional ADP-heptose synthase (sugar kinase/adenylyltransferase)
LITFDRPTTGDATEQMGRLLSEYLPALSPMAIDPLGCGDALLATASLTLAAGGTLQQAAYLGAAAAAIEVRQMGNRPVGADELATAATNASVAAPSPVPAAIAA